MGMPAFGIVQCFQAQVESYIECAASFANVLGKTEGDLNVNEGIPTATEGRLSEREGN